jgi:hypothetical protein
MLSINSIIIFFSLAGSSLSECQTNIEQSNQHLFSNSTELNTLTESFQLHEDYFQSQWPTGVTNKMQYDIQISELLPAPHLPKVLETILLKMNDKNKNIHINYLFLVLILHSLFDSLSSTSIKNENGKLTVMHPNTSSCGFMLLCGIRNFFSNYFGISEKIGHEIINSYFKFIHRHTKELFTGLTILIINKWCIGKTQSQNHLHTFISKIMNVSLFIKYLNVNSMKL